MSVSVGRRLSHGMLHLGSVGVIVAGMAAIDERFRGHLLDALNGDLPMAVRFPDLRVSHLSQVLSNSMGLPTDVQFPLVVFAVFSFVLFLAMFRS